MSYHFSRETRRQFNQAGIEFVPSVDYTPILNPIERYFSVLKQKVKTLKLKRLIEGRFLDMKQIILEARD